MRILMVEDDLDLCEAVRTALAGHGHEVDICNTGRDGLETARDGSFDCILLDRMMPEMDGLSVLRILRGEGDATPVIFVTALDGVGDRVDGLDAGADDYLVKPFAIEELLARVRALSRRPSQWENTQKLQLGDIEFDPPVAYLTGPKGSCTLSKRESQLLEFLVKNTGQILPRTVLLSRVWGPYAPVEDGNLDNYIHFLRRRLRTVGSVLTISTIRSVGYRLDGAPGDAVC